MGYPCIEVVLEGPRDIARAFVWGFIRGRGGKHPVVDLEHEDFNCETLRERLADILRPGHSISHLLVAAENSRDVREAVADLEAQGVSAKVLEERKIREARFEYSVQVYAPELAERVRDLFDSPPTGVQVTPEKEFEEKLDEKEVGTGLYAPVHAYQFLGRGTVHGEPFEIVKFWRSCVREEAIEARGARVIEVDAKS